MAAGAVRALQISYEPVDGTGRLSLANTANDPK